MTLDSPLWPLLANVFMFPLKESIVPTLKDCLIYWKRCVDDTHAYIQPYKIDYVMKKLNTYHQQTQFTYELEKDQRISFFDVLIRFLVLMRFQVRKKLIVGVQWGWWSNSFLTKPNAVTSHLETLMMVLDQVDKDFFSKFDQICGFGRIYWRNPLFFVQWLEHLNICFCVLSGCSNKRLITGTKTTH